MLVRAEQVNALSEVRRRSFEERVAAHLHRCFGRWCADVGEETVNQTIRDGVSHASAHGIESERDVCKYIDLMVVLGRDFDLGTSHPWVIPILHDPETADPSARIDSLYESARKRAYLKRAAAHGGA